MMWLELLKLQITLNKCLVEPQFENLGLRFPVWERRISYRLLTADFAKRVNKFPVDFLPVQFCQQLEHLGACMSGQTVSESRIWSHSLTLLTSHWNSKGLIFELLSLRVYIYTYINISLQKKSRKFHDEAVLTDHQDCRVKYLKIKFTLSNILQVPNGRNTWLK